MKLNPYLSFDGTCRDAMTFYKDVLGGDLTLQTFAESPMADKFPAGMQQRIIHSMLTDGNFVLMATDMQGPNGFKPGNDISIALNFDDESRLRRCFNALAEGGQILDPVKRQFWGGIFGVVRDKFGKEWMLECSSDEVDSQATRTEAG